MKKAVVYPFVWPVCFFTRHLPLWRFERVTALHLNKCFQLVNSCVGIPKAPLVRRPKRLPRTSSLMMISWHFWRHTSSFEPSWYQLRLTCRVDIWYLKSSQFKYSAYFLYCHQIFRRKEGHDPDSDVFRKSRDKVLTLFYLKKDMQQVVHAHNSNLFCPYC